MIQIGPIDICVDKREIRLHGQAAPIGSRAFDILELLIRANGALVTKDEIIRRVWPHAVVEENNLQVHISALRKALGDERGLIVTVPGRGYRLLASRSHAGVPSKASGLPHDEPRSSLYSGGSPVSLVGRERAVKTALAALDDAPVVTLVGAGGVGKTRVAMEVAKQASARFAPAVVVVSLAAVSDPHAVPNALAAALGITHTASLMSIDAVVACVGSHPLLVVLDTCEHVIDAAAQLAGALVNAHPALRILATSRETLRVPGERVLSIAPLDLPDEQDDTDTMLQASAVQLFIARAQAADLHLPLDIGTVSQVAAICRRLDGLPLAIELAAVRAAALGVQALAAHPDDVFSLLKDGFRTSPPRHRSLLASYGWSERLLDVEERMVLRRLCALTGSFGWDRLERAVDGRMNGVVNLLDIVTRLVSKSMVMRETVSGSPRYRLLGATRAFALRRDANHNDADLSANAATLADQPRSAKRSIKSGRSNCSIHQLSARPTSSSRHAR
jgi:predicted ATPase/DNA-binding winged helix-turn-helix (wHTH) protein